MNGSVEPVRTEPDYDPFMPEVVEGDPYPIYRRLRERTPRLFIEQYNAWFFSTFEDVWNLTRSRELSVELPSVPILMLTDRRSRSSLARRASD